VLARIATDNEASIALHQALGFDVVGIEKQVGRKFNRWLDVMLLQNMLE
jgi:phosphinothricin acetyltransferase